MLVGLSAAVPSCAVVLRLDSRVEGVGVDPRQPPLAWEAWDGQRWVECASDEDTTGGLNRPGELVLHVPAGHTPPVGGRPPARWRPCPGTAPGARPTAF